MVELIGQYTAHRGRYTRDKKDIPQMLHDKIASFESELVAHDKKFAADNSITNIAELTASFADLDAKVKDVESRIVEGVIGL